MRFNAPLDDVFTGPSSVRVLRVLVELPEGFGVSAREIARRAGVSHPTASKVLSNLAEQGLVSIRRSSRGDEYGLNRIHALAPELLALFDHERTMLERLLQFLAFSLGRHAPDVERAVVFGSVARGDMTPESDIDLAVASRSSLRSDIEAGMQAVADEVRDRFGNRLSVLVVDPTLLELEAGAGRKRGWARWRRILKDGIPVDLPVVRTRANA